MAILGFILIGIGIILFFVQKNQKAKAFSIGSARPTTAAELKQTAASIAGEIGGGNWRDYVKVSGIIKCDRPLTSELKEDPCVHYAMTVRREYEETVTKEDSDGNTTTETETNSETVSSNKQSVGFQVEDATGQIEVDPTGADLETIKILDEFRPEESAGGMLSFGRFSLAVSHPSSNRRTLGYRYSESILPLERRVLVIGMVTDNSGNLLVKKPNDGDRKFLISLRDEEELKANAQRSAQAFFWAMVVCFVLGAILVLIGLVS